MQPNCGEPIKEPYGPVPMALMLSLTFIPLMTTAHEIARGNVYGAVFAGALTTLSAVMTAQVSQIVAETRDKWNARRGAHEVPSSSTGPWVAGEIQGGAPPIVDVGQRLMSRRAASAPESAPEASKPAAPRPLG